MTRGALQRVLETSGPAMGSTQIWRGSIRILLLHASHFHAIAFFLFSPVAASLFTAHALARRFPAAPPSVLGPVRRPLEQNGVPAALLPVLANSLFSAVVCLPSSLSFSLLGTAATARSVARCYGGGGLPGRRFSVGRGMWGRLLETCFWELSIVLVLCSLMVGSLVAVLKVVNAAAAGGRSSAWCSWGALGVLGVPFCVGFAHLMVVGKLARVVTVLEGDCSGLHALAKARGMVEKRTQTALFMALVSGVGTRLVEGLFELRSSRGMHLWEASVLVSMYSLALVFETIQHVVFYCGSKSLVGD